MVKYDKDSWPQFTLGAKRVRSCWFGQTWLAHWAEICYDPGYRVVGHFGWITFWFDKKHLTVVVGPNAGLYIRTWRRRRGTPKRNNK